MEDSWDAIDCGDGEVREDVFFLFKGEKNDRVERKVRKNQITLERVAMMFDLEPSTIYIVEEFGEELAEWPNRDGRFDMSVFRKGSSLRVEGRSRSAATPKHFAGSPSLLPNLMSKNTATTSTDSTFSPLFRSVVPGKKKVTYTLKVTLAERKGSKIINHTRQTYIMLNEGTANVNYIKDYCRQEFGDDSLIMVSGNGLKVEDSDVTRGINFWKSNSRKIYAVPVAQETTIKKIKKESGATHATITVGDDSDGNECQVAKKPKLSRLSKQDIIDGLRETLPELVREGVNDALSEITLEANKKKIMQTLHAAFMCVICQKSAKPQVVVSTCCSSILGCKTCVDRWYEANSTCPKCRNDQHELHDCIPLKGFDDVLLGLSEFD